MVGLQSGLSGVQEGPGHSEHVLGMDAGGVQRAWEGCRGAQRQAWRVGARAQREYWGCSGVEEV